MGAMDQTASNSPPPSLPPQVVPRRERTSRVLAVDDDPVILGLLRATLHSAGCEVLVAGSGAQAIEAARTHRPDLILLDVRMDDMDGHAVCRELKADETTADIPIIFVTALDDNQEIAQGFALGAVDYITKPLQVPVVLARVKTHLALHHQRRSLEGMFRDVIEFAPDAFVLTDAAGAIVQINARAEELFGYARAALVGRPVEQLVPPRLRQMHQRHRRDYVAQAGKLRMGTGIPCLREDGTEFAADINIAPLQTSRGTMLMALVRDATEREQHEARLRELAARSEAAIEEERKHIAREVHDELGQILTALRMDVSLLTMRFAGRDPLLTAKINDMKALIDRGIQGVRNVAANLRPAALDMGLVPALEWLCDDTAARTGLACTLHAPEPQPALEPGREVVLYRIAQEAITNAVRYAHAREVEVLLMQRGGELVLKVRDDGEGFDPAAVAGRKSFGLLGMHERAHALGGQVEVRSAPGAGTTLNISIPLAAEAGEAS